MPRASFQVEENSSGWKAIQRMLQSLRQGDSYVKAGVTGKAAVEQHDDEADDEGLTNVDLAVIHEFGVPGRIPARPFINGTFVLRRDEYVRRLRQLLPAVYEAKITIAFMLEVVGQQMASDMRTRMVEGTGIPPPLAASTIRRKRAKGAWNKNGKAQAAGQEPRPLVETGRMRNSITHEVVMQESKR